MSNKRKLKKTKETTDYTIQNFIDDEVQKFGDKIEAVMKEAKEGGKHGVMIVGTEDVYVCDLVPYGRVHRAGSQEAVDKKRAQLEQEQ